jgi:hypothetical protein
MPITLEWENDNTLLIVNFDDDWTDDEYYEAVTEANRQVEERGQKVDVILNTSESGVLGNTPFFKRGKRTLNVMPKNVKRLLIVGGNELSRAMVSTFFKIYKPAGVEIEMVGSMYIAREKLK